MLLSLSLCVLLAQFSDAVRPTNSASHHFLRPSVPKAPLHDPSSPVIRPNDGKELAPYDTVNYFDQLIDHNNASLGTFKQRFWHTYEAYQPGGPIILFMPGEFNAESMTGYLTNRTISGMIAAQQNGSVVVLEHRFFGLSNPLPDLSAESLQLLTIQQAIDDLAYFSQNVHLPMPNGDKLTSDLNSWVLVGGSYAGALTSYTMVNKPGVFQAAYSSSAPVETIMDYWTYFEPIRLNMPQNCSADAQAVISYIDSVLDGGNATAIQGVKDNFGLGGIVHLDDFAIA
ncbi:hypothetical protein H0H93_012724, partial [Arthromyces matolae]